MTSRVLPQPDLPHVNGSQSGGLQSGSASSSTDSTWMRQTVRQFFGNFNWNDNPPEVQELRQTVSNGQLPLSLTLTVKQFFTAIDWDGNQIASLPAPEQPAVSVNPVDAFTLDDFSDLF